MNIRAVYHIARADFLERVRRYSFLVTLLFAVYLGYAAATGKIALRLGDYRVLFNLEGNVLRIVGVRHRSKAYR